MVYLGLILLSFLVQVISGQDYSDLAKDDCFKRIYTCGDYRASVTDGTGKLATEKYRFAEICRKHKQFIACIEKAAEFCVGKLHEFSSMVLDNRRSIKLFCTDKDWKHDYFAAASCINKKEQRASDECLEEVSEKGDGRPEWCLIPEPCESYASMLDCTVRKLNEQCSNSAGEVYRRLHILKMENRDVVCEFRRRNPRYCRYDRKPRSVESAKQSSTIKNIGTAVLDNINESLETAVLNKLTNLLPLLNGEPTDSKFVKSKLMKRVSEAQSDEPDQIEMPSKTCLSQEDLASRLDKFRELIGHLKNKLYEAMSESSSHLPDYEQRIMKYCKLDDLNLDNCLMVLEELDIIGARELPLKELKNLEKLYAPQQALKDYIGEFLDMLLTDKDFELKYIGGESETISWKYKCNNSPIEFLSCWWTGHGLQCSLKKKAFMAAEIFSDTKKFIKDSLRKITEFLISECPNENYENTEFKQNLKKFYRRAFEDIHRSGEHVDLSEKIGEVESKAKDEVEEQSKHQTPPANVKDPLEIHYQKADISSDNTESQENELHPFESVFDFENQTLVDEIKKKYWKEKYLDLVRSELESIINNRLEYIALNYLGLKNKFIGDEFFKAKPEVKSPPNEEAIDKIFKELYLDSLKPDWNEFNSRLSTKHFKINKDIRPNIKEGNQSISHRKQDTDNTIKDEL